MNPGAPPLMAESDETLVSRTVRLKDATAYAELVRRYEQKILLLQQRLTGERALAEDLSQETFLRAWQKLDTFSGAGSFRPSQSLAEAPMPRNTGALRRPRVIANFTFAPGYGSVGVEAYCLGFPKVPLQPVP